MRNTNEQRGILWLRLSPASQERLRAAYPPRYETAYYHHVTLLFDIPQAVAAPYIGRQAAVAVYAHGFNDRIEAVRVRSDLPDTYGAPHITLSAQPGVQPFASVAMLQGEHTETARRAPLSLTGTIEFVPLPHAEHKDAKR